MCLSLCISDTHKCGELDYKNCATMLRFQRAENFLGFAAITVLVGYDDFGIPIDLQFVGCPWFESTLPHLGHADEGKIIKHYLIKVVNGTLKV
ncbi:hypothetical protein SUGI_0790600 [Cryptomeria japonica]|nr:hypothetical protein SUGI_0790600 [Cryptomeria japonica]